MQVVAEVRFERGDGVEEADGFFHCG
jgi:hypothetical protein